jgi:hypothetical protein
MDSHFILSEINSLKAELVQLKDEVKTATGEKDHESLLLKIHGPNTLSVFHYQLQFQVIYYLFMLIRWLFLLLSSYVIIYYHHILYLSVSID